MLTSINDPEVQAVLDQARTGQSEVFPSPEDWRDQWIYFLMLDRFENPGAPPRNLPYDAAFNEFQGGTYNGVRERLKYLQQLGVGAIWLSPVLKNPQFDKGAYHGYGIQNFLAVEPRFASSPEKAESELRQLVDEAHALGIYVIFDIVLHHAGDVFAYAITQGGITQEFGQVDWSDTVLPIRWRDANGNGNLSWTDAPARPPYDATVFPDELRQNAWFTRQGNASGSSGFHPFGDFETLKGIATDAAENGLLPVHNILIRSYQYIIAKFDVDAFRIDTLKYLSPDFERIFGNAMREFALSIGKKNFFTFGEVYDDENTIAQFIGRNTSTPGGVIGVDAALDYPLFFKLPGVLKGLAGTPLDVANVFENRKRVEQDIITSHGEAGKLFVTFLDNHDQAQRFGFTGNTQLIDQIALGLGCLYSLQGIPCLYYGTEQGLSGHKDQTHIDDSLVREALWGRPDATGQPNGFDITHPLYLAVQQITKVRAEQPELRYGRQYFRPISGNRTEFGISSFPSGVLAFSRILNDQEVVVVAATDTVNGFQGEVIIDHELNPQGAAYKILYSNKQGTGGAKAPGVVVDKPAGSVTIREIDGSVTSGPVRTLPVDLQALEIQILGR